MGIKVKDLAKELGMSSVDIMEALKKLYVDVESESTSVNDKVAALMRVKLGLSNKSKEKTKKPETLVKKNKETAEKELVETEGKPSKVKKSLKETGKLGLKSAVKSPLEETKKKDVEIATEEVSEGLKESSKRAESVSVKDEKKPELKEPAIKSLLTVKSEDKLETLSKEKPKGILPKKEEIPAKVFDIEESLVRKKLAHKKLIEKKMDFVDTKKGKIKFWKSNEFRIPRKTRNPKDMARKVEIAYEEIKPYTGTDFKKIELAMPVNIRTIAVKVNKRPNDIMQYAIRRGHFININQDLDESLIRDLLKGLGYELAVSQTIEEDLMAEHLDEATVDRELRAPVVTFMGHVDHGKTSLLDYIRKSMVAKGEKGGITQHIGAYKVLTSKGPVTFLDTPGHAAFTAMRARGAGATDIVVLVVAADDGVMPQTKEAIDHARAAGVPIVVAINKCDLPGASPQKVKVALQKENILAEEYGGKTVMVEVSAKTGKGINNLLEMLAMEAELLELRATPALRARGVVIESKKSSGQGVTATVLVKNGTLHTGDIILSGIYYGRVKAMIDDKGQRLKDALPSTPVEILGLEGVPEAGDDFFVVKDEKKAKNLALLRQGETRRKGMASGKRVTLEDFHARLLEGKIKELRIILKADVQGSLEAIKHSLEELSTEEVKISFVHMMVGNISESDVMLAVVSDAVIIGFHVKVDPNAEELAKRENIDIRLYDIIYESIEDVKAAMEGLLEPIEEEEVQGVAQVKEVFSAKKGRAAGSIVVKGTIHRKDKIKIKRGTDVIFNGNIESLRRFKDDVKEVKEGFECGISFPGYNDLRSGDVIEAYIIKKIARRLTK